MAIALLMLQLYSKHKLAFSPDKSLLRFLKLRKVIPALFAYFCVLLLSVSEVLVSAGLTEGLIETFLLINTVTTGGTMLEKPLLC
jgi:hypothetical protein